MAFNFFKKKKSKGGKDHYHKLRLSRAFVILGIVAQKLNVPIGKVVFIS